MERGVNSFFEEVILAKYAINLGDMASANSSLLGQTVVTLNAHAITKPN